MWCQLSLSYQSIKERYIKNTKFKEGPRRNSDSSVNSFIRGEDVDSSNESDDSSSDDDTRKIDRAPYAKSKKKKVPKPNVVTLSAHSPAPKNN